MSSDYLKDETNLYKGTTVYRLNFFITFPIVSNYQRVEEKKDPSIVLGLGKSVRLGYYVDINIVTVRYR